MSQVQPRSKRFLALTLVLALVAAVTTVIAADTSTASANPAPVQLGFVPLPTDQFQAVMEAANPAADTTLDFTVGITSSGAGAIVTYDEWEDGYEADLANPVQSTTKMWGDGNTGNGNAASLCALCVGDLIPQGAVMIGRNNITTPRNPAQIRFDGRDQVASTRGFSLTAGGFSTPLGSVLSGAVSSFDTSKYGTDYVVPVGEDTAVPAGTSPAFEYTGAVVMASQDSTTVQVDLDDNGTFDQASSVNKGEVVFVNGGLQEGAHIVTSKPVQVHLATADVGATYESRWFTLFPTPLLSSDYLNPVGSNDNNQRTIVYLHNPNNTSITVTPTCASCSGTIVIPAKSNASFATPLGEAVRFASAGNKPFMGVGAAGAQSGASPGSATDNSSTYDWGFTLVPTSLLTTQAVLGWAPGNSANPPASAGAGEEDDNPVWITTLTATSLHVDYDGDPSTGAIASADCFGARHDADIAVGALASTRIIDAADSDMTGARIYTCDSTKIAGAWGEDPSNAPSGSPGFDAGYTLIPSTTMIVEKTSSTFTDSNADGKVGPGDTLAYDVAIADAGSLAFTNVEINDSAPPGTTFVPGSTTLFDGIITTPVADDSPSALTAFPLDEGGLALPNVSAGATLHVRYKLAIDNPYHPSGSLLTNTANVTSDEASGSDVNVVQLASSDLSLTQSQIGTPAHTGDNAIFHLVLTNSGPDTAAGVFVADQLPAGLVYVSSVAAQGSYDPVTGSWNVGTLANGASTTLDITATVNVVSAVNRAQVSASGSVDIDSQPLENALDAGHAPDQDDEAIASVSVTVLSTSVLGDTVWNDTNGNGTQDAGEAGIADVDLTIIGAGPDATFGTGDDTTTIRTSGPTGTWSLTGLQAGDYKVTVDTNTLPAGSLVTTFDADGTSTPNVTTFALGAGQTRNDIDFGYRTPPGASEPSTPAATGYDVSITNKLVGSLAKGSTAKYVLTVKNNGPDASSALTVVDTLPDGVTFVSATGEGWVCNLAGSTVVCAHESGLANGKTSTIDIKVKATGNVGLSAINHATVAADGDLVSTNNDASVEAAVLSPLAKTGADVWFWLRIATIALLIGFIFLMCSHLSKQPDGRQY